MSAEMNPMSQLRITKVCVNIGVGEGGERLVNAENVLELVTGVKPQRTLGRIQNRDLKVRVGAPIGCKATMRSQEEIKAFFPKEVVDAKGYAGCFGVYPRRRVVSKLEIPEETENHEYFESHELTAPLEETVTKRTAFGTHWVLVYFFGEDPYVMRDLLKHQEDLDFYV